METLQFAASHILHLKLGWNNANASLNINKVSYKLPSTCYRWMFALTDLPGDETLLRGFLVSLPE